ncbi:hypothetical protein Poli38472_001939 [Pythium oligandrum]|uniref:Iojap-like ribosome-associated protein n=1 Tax=Pythium oligandrum TaxID=41045 RepID=A0A8K1CVN1_PYTOL|nr:hypothetical protein Poli38472_001939 [Pythium oligandrum]|eukprot:TMW69783.1 hypothetical protein Poli38472_001939 [Pythium oligandrum]
MQLARVFYRVQRAAAARKALIRCAVSTSTGSATGGFQLARMQPLRSFQTSTVLRVSADDEHKTTKAAVTEEHDEEDEDDDVEEIEDALADDDAVDGEEEDEGVAMAAQYLGVQYNPANVKKYSAELEIDGYIISGGDFWTALDAAKGYDELVDLYCDLDTPRNFPAGSDSAEAALAASAPSSAFAMDGATSEWEVPDVGKRNAEIIPPVAGQYLTIDEVLEALEREKAIDVYTVNLTGKSSLADYMIFTTGRSQAHMRRMADMMIQSMKARNLSDDFDYAVEGRDCDDWMIADCNNVVVHFMREDTRRILNLEDHWENMENDKHKVYGDMTEDEYMDKFGTSELMEYLEDDDYIEADENGKVDPRKIDWE